MVDAELSALRRTDGVWLVLLTHEGAAPMEFTCENEQQAHAFAQSLRSAKRPHGAVAQDRPPPSRARFHTA